MFQHKPSKTLENARKENNQLRKKMKSKNATLEDVQNFNQSLKVYNFLLKTSKDNQKANKVKWEEKLYHKNFYKYSKRAVNGSLYKEEIVPTFDSSTANAYYSKKYGMTNPIDKEKLAWFPTIEAPKVAYNESPITPKVVKAVLKKKSPNSAPGEDGILYGFLKTPNYSSFYGNPLQQH